MLVQHNIPMANFSLAISRCLSASTPRATWLICLSTSAGKTPDGVDNLLFALSQSFSLIASFQYCHHDRSVVFPSQTSCLSLISAYSNCFPSLHAAFEISAPLRI